MSTLLETINKNNYHPLTNDDRKAFDEAFEGFVGVNYEPILVRDSSNIGVVKKSFICKGTIIYPGAKAQIYKVTISKVVHQDAKWQIEDIQLIYPANGEFNLRPLTVEDVENFFKKYPPMLGQSKTPICIVQTGGMIGGHEYYLVKVTIMAQPFSSSYILLPL